MNQTIITESKRIGRRQTLLVAALAMILGYTAMALLFLDLFWIMKIPSHDGFLIFLGILLVFIFAYFFGGLVGKKMIVNKKHHLGLPFLCALSVFFFPTAITSTISYFVHQNEINAIHYLTNPFLFILGGFTFTIIPFGLTIILLFGYWLGKRIKIQLTRISLDQV